MPEIDGEYVYPDPITEPNFFLGSIRPASVEGWTYEESDALNNMSSEAPWVGNVGSRFAFYRPYEWGESPDRGDPYLEIFVDSGTAVIQYSFGPEYDANWNFYDWYREGPGIIPWSEPSGTLTLVPGLNKLSLPMTGVDPANDPLAPVLVKVDVISGSVAISRLRNISPRSDGTVLKASSTVGRWTDWQEGVLDDWNPNAVDTPANPGFHRSATVWRTFPPGVIHDLGYPGVWPAFTYADYAADANPMKDSLPGTPWSGVSATYEEGDTNFMELRDTPTPYYHVTRHGGFWVPPSFDLVSQRDSVSAPVPGVPQTWQVRNQSDPGYSATVVAYYWAVPEVLTEGEARFSTPWNLTLEPWMGKQDVHWAWPPGSPQGAGARYPVQWESLEWEWVGWQFRTVRSQYRPPQDAPDSWGRNHVSEQQRMALTWETMYFNDSYAWPAFLAEVPDPTLRSEVFPWSIGDPWPMPGTAEYNASAIVPAVSSGGSDAWDLPPVPIPGTEDWTIKARTILQWDSSSNPEIRQVGLVGETGNPDLAPIVRTPRWRVWRPGLRVEPLGDYRKPAPLHVGTLDGWRKVGYESWDEGPGRLKVRVPTSQSPSGWLMEVKPGDDATGARTMHLGTAEGHVHGVRFIPWVRP